MVTLCSNSVENTYVDHAGFKVVRVQPLGKFDHVTADRA